MTIYADWNFLFFRYVYLSGPGFDFEGLVLQAPWWDVKTTIKRGKILLKWGRDHDL